MTPCAVNASQPKGPGRLPERKTPQGLRHPTLAESLLCTGFAYAVRETHYNLDNFHNSS